MHRSDVKGERKVLRACAGDTGSVQYKTDKTSPELSRQTVYCINIMGENKNIVLGVFVCV